jgi:hypothetical protein
MPIRITLSNSEVIEVDIPLEDWNGAYRRALDGNTMLEIQEPDGHILSINPRRVELVEATDQPADQPAGDQAQVA